MKRRLDESSKPIQMKRDSLQGELTIYKVMNVSSSHILDLPYESKCNYLHGHNYKVEVWATGKPDDHGMVVDFNHIKKVVMALDHVHLNDVLEPATAEWMAVVIADRLAEKSGDNVSTIKVRVWETDTCYAEYSRSAQE